MAALADGSLAPERRAELEAKVSTTPELAERLAEQQRALSLVQSATAEVEAPAALRARIEAQRRGRRANAPPRLLLIAGAAATVLALAIGLSIIGSETAPQQFRAALAPTTLVPDAKGEATLTKTSSGWRIELDAAGLPRLDNGRFYEAWLRDAAGTLIPVGTFNEGQRVTLWAGVPPTEFTTLTVTREKADGDQASSGEKVLVGTVDVGDSG